MMEGDGKRKLFQLSRREFLKVLYTAGLVNGLGFLTSVGYASFVEPDKLDVTEVELRLPHLPDSFDGYRLVHFSDIHADDWMTKERLGEIVDVVNAQDADSVAITGDFVTGGPEHQMPYLISEIGRLVARDAKVAVMGNHDYWTNAEMIRVMLKKSGITELKNDVVSLRRGGETLHLCGLDDYWERHANLPKLMKRLPEDGCAVLLVHEPDFADISAETGRFDLQISGHSHGGQVVFPFIGPRVLPDYGRKYPLGLYEVEGMYVYTNRGVGMASPRIRFNCRPEITVYVFRSGGD